MWSLPALNTLNQLSARVGSREAHRLFTSRLRVDGDRANEVLAEPLPVESGETIEVVIVPATEAA